MKEEANRWTLSTSMTERSFKCLIKVLVGVEPEGSRLIIEEILFHLDSKLIGVKKSRRFKDFF